MYHQIRTNKGNLFFSPYSISTALAMTYAGSRGETEKQMAKALSFTLPQVELHPAFAKLQGELDKIQKAGKVKIHVANSLWPQEGFVLRRKFLALMERDYDTILTALDYGQTEESRQIINRWVEENTQDKIK